MKKLLASLLITAQALWAPLALAADDAPVSMYAHATNMGAGSTADDVPPSAYVHITNFGGGSGGAFMFNDAFNATSAALGNTVNKFQGLQFGIAQGDFSLGATGSGYVAGNTVTLQCPGVTFSTSPIIGITDVSGVIDGSTIVIPGVTTGSIPDGSLICTQASTSGVGSGATWNVKFGVIASYLSIPKLTTGGSGFNGNLFLNYGDATPFSAQFSGYENTFVGDKAGGGFIGGNNALSRNNTALGHNPCGDGGGGVASDNNTCIGNDAGRNIQGLGSRGHNVLIGVGAGRNIANGWNTWVGEEAGGSGALNIPGALSGLNNVGLGYLVAPAITSGSGNLLLGTKSGSGLVAGNENIILQATAGVDGCILSDVSNQWAICPGHAGPVISGTGGDDPGTSTTNVYGSLSVAAVITGNMGGGQNTAAFQSISSNPAFAWHNTGAAANNGWWDAVVSGSTFSFRAINDADSAAADFMDVIRSGVTISSIVFRTGVGSGALSIDGSQNVKLEASTYANCTVLKTVSGVIACGP